MMIAFLPFLTYPGSSSSKVGPSAVLIAKHLGATLHATAVNVDIPPVSNALAQRLLDLPKEIREAERRSRAMGKSMLEAFRAEASLGSCDLTIDETEAPPALMGDVAAERARYFDIALTGWEKDNPTCDIVAEALIFGSGRPVLLLPEAVTIGPMTHVVIAWDASRTAARAVADARPFLERATKVTVLTVADEKVIPGRDAGETLAEGLRHRGLAASAKSIAGDGRPIAEALQTAAVQLGGDLLVMGGYGHSRLREFVLGGATQGILDDMRMPALLSH